MEDLGTQEEIADGRDLRGEEIQGLRDELGESGLSDVSDISE